MSRKSSSYWSRTRTLVLTVITVSFTPMLVVGALALYEFKISYDRKVTDHLGELVAKHKQTIDRFLNAQVDQIRILARTAQYENLCEARFLEKTLEAFHKEQEPVVVDLGLIDADGKQVAYAGPFRLGRADYSGAEWLSTALGSEHFISDVFKGLRGLPHFIVAIRGEQNERPWILRATIDFGAFNDLVESTRVGQTGFAFILNRQGAFQTKPLNDFDLRRGPYRHLLASGSAGDDIRIARHEGHDGADYLYVAAPLKGGEWLLIYQQRADDAFSSYHSARDVILWIVLLSALAIVASAYFLARRMVLRLTKDHHERQLMRQTIVETGKLASVGELAAGIAHEINNPVAIMVEEAGWIQDLLEDDAEVPGEHDGEVRRALTQIRDQGRRCKEITHKLLSFARKTDSRRQEVDLQDLVEEIVALETQRSRYANVEFVTQMEQDLPPVHGSVTELQQVFLNLVNNALDAMERDGGTITISARRSGDMVKVFVADTGPGIPQANLERIFDPFFTTKAVGRGTGLGLSICYGIIVRMGGEIQVRSVVGVGTTFRITLPIHRPAPAQEPDAGRIQARDLNRETGGQP
jgi:two-component system NtrC family sensor kinase